MENVCYKFICTILHCIITCNNFHFCFVVFKILLALSNLETNTGPKPNNFKTKKISFVYNYVYSLHNSVDVIYNELSEYDVIGITDT